MTGTVTWLVVAGSLSVAITSVLLLLFRLPPPAGESTLIVSLGILSSPTEIGGMVAAVVLVTLACWLLNTALGLTPPAKGAWASGHSSSRAPQGPSTLSAPAPGPFHWCPRGTP